MFCIMFEITIYEATNIIINYEFQDINRISN